MMAQTAKPTDRFVVNAGADDAGAPYVEIVDKLACSGMRFDPPLALRLAQAMIQAVFAVMSMRVQQVSNKARHKAIMVARN